MLIIRIGAHTKRDPPHPKRKKAVQLLNQNVNLKKRQLYARELRPYTVKVKRVAHAIFGIGTD